MEEKNQAGRGKEIEMKCERRIKKKKEEEEGLEVVRYG